MELTNLALIGMLASGAFAGLLGALVGVGGGLVIVPTLFLIFGVDMKVAVACSLVGTVASSTTAGSVYVGKGLANMRLGMFLEIATTLGAIAGGLTALALAPHILSGLFGALLLVTSLLMFRAQDQSLKIKPEVVSDGADQVVEGKEDQGGFSGAYYDVYHRNLVPYQVKNLTMGSVVSFFAGGLSGMLGIGGGFIKVPAMTLGMGVPMKVASATSNFMIGVTAVASLFIYLANGFVHPLIASVIALGVVVGALFGTTVSQRISPTLLRRIFGVLMIFVSVQMLLKAGGG